MFERFTDKARRVVVCSQEVARQLSHPLIDTEHLLLAMTRDDVGCSAVALNEVGLNYDNLVEEVQKIHLDEVKVSSDGHIPFTLAARRVFELAMRETLDQGHDNIDSGHILLGVIRLGEGHAVAAIKNLGVNISDLRLRVIELMPAANQRPASVHPKAITQQRAQLRALIARKSITKAKLIEAFDKIVDGLSEEEVNRTLELLK